MTWKKIKLEESHAATEIELPNNFQEVAHKLCCRSPGQRSNLSSKKKKTLSLNGSLFWIVLSLTSSYRVFTFTEISILPTKIRFLASCFTIVLLLQKNQPMNFITQTAQSFSRNIPPVTTSCFYHFTVQCRTYARMKTTEIRRQTNWRESVIQVERWLKKAWFTMQWFFIHAYQRARRFMDEGRVTCHWSRAADCLHVTKLSLWFAQVQSVHNNRSKSKLAD